MHWFYDPIVKHYFDFKGIASRKQFWMYVILTNFFNIVIGVFAALYLAGAAPIFTMIISLAIALPSWGITVRRFHDVGMSGYWALLLLYASTVVFFPVFLIPFILVDPSGVFTVIAIVLFITAVIAGGVALLLLARKSKIEGNRFRPQPISPPVFAPVVVDTHSNNKKSQTGGL